MVFSSAAFCQPQCWAALHAAVDSCDWWHRTSVVLGGPARNCRLTVGAAPRHSRCHRRGHQSKIFDHRKHSAKAKIAFLCPLPINGVFRYILTNANTTHRYRRSRHPKRYKSMRGEEGMAVSGSRSGGGGVRGLNLGRAGRGGGVSQGRGGTVDPRAKR